MKWSHSVIIITLIGAATFAGCLDDEVGEDEDDGEAYIISINSIEVDKEHIFENYDLHEITDSNEDTYSGVRLKEILADNGIDDLSMYTFRIIASDGWLKEVTHLDMEEGILVEEDTMTVFPDLPGKYRVRDLVTIEILTDGDTITVNGKYWTWMQPFDILEEAVMFDSESIEYKGIKLSDLINFTAVANPQDHNYTIEASDGYTKEVTWTDMMNGLLVNDDEHMTVFPHLESKFWVKDVMEISVVLI